MGRENIFTDLYNKVMSFFVTSPVEDPTKEKAMSRLKVVLMQDRVGFSERALQMLKGEMVSSISKYMEIDDDLFELQLEAQDDKTMLILTIPVIRPKTDEEIDLAIKEQAEKTQVKAEEIVQELEGIIEERAQALAEELAENKQDDGDEDDDQDRDEDTDGECVQEDTEAIIEALEDIEDADDNDGNEDSGKAEKKMSETTGGKGKKKSS